CASDLPNCSTTRVTPTSASTVRGEAGGAAPGPWRGSKNRVTSPGRITIIRTSFLSTPPPLTIQNLRNIAIFSHVDHGKTTLVVKLPQQSRTLGRKEQGAERIMESN